MNKIYCFTDNFISIIDDLHESIIHGFRNDYIHIYKYYRSPMINYQKSYKI